MTVTSPTRPFRFGVHLRSDEADQTWVELARRAETLGYSTLLIPDHMSDQFAAVPAMAAAAVATSTIRIGALVLANDFRHPAVLAKELATIDVLSGGRLEVGIGAGWRNADYQQTGIAKDTAGVRIDRLVEAIGVLKGLWAEGAFSTAGTHYAVDGLDGFPKPLQRPHPPLLIGGGAPRMLRVAAENADIVGINPSLHTGEFGLDGGAARSLGMDVTERIGWVREAAGERFDSIELNVITFLGVHLVDDRRAFAADMGGRLGLDPADLLSSPFALIGSPAAIVDHLQSVRERWGISYVVVQGADQLEMMAPVVSALSGT